MTTINKTRPSCARVKVKMGLLFKFPRFVEMEIVNEETKESRLEMIIFTTICYQSIVLTVKCKVMKRKSVEYYTLSLGGQLLQLKRRAQRLMSNLYIQIIIVRRQKKLFKKEEGKRLCEDTGTPPIDCLIRRRIN